MQTALEPTIRRVRTSGYLIFTLVAIVPIIELIAAAWPFHPGLPTWRFGVVAVAAGSAGTPLLCLFFLFVLAHASAHPGVVRTVSIISALAAILYACSMSVFVLDALQVKSQIRQQAAERYAIASVWALIKLSFASACFAVLATGAWRAARSMIRERGRKSSERHASLLVRG